RVAKGRNMTVEQVDRVARGQVWTGDAAYRHGLVDRLGGFADALAEARRRAGLGPRAEIVVRPERRERLIDYVLGGGLANGKQEEGGDGEPQPMLRLPKELAQLLPMWLGIAQAGSDA